MRKKSLAEELAELANPAPTKGTSMAGVHLPARGHFKGAYRQPLNCHAPSPFGSLAQNTTLKPMCLERLRG